LKIQFDLDERVIRGIEAKMARAGVHTKREMFNLALSLLDWAVDERTQGRIIASVDPATERYNQVVLPALENLRKISLEESAPKVKGVGAGAGGNRS
jgi:hypothetical protein